MELPPPEWVIRRAEVEGWQEPQWDEWGLWLRRFREHGYELEPDDSGIAAIEDGVWRNGEGLEDEPYALLKALPRLFWKVTALDLRHCVEHGCPSEWKPGDDDSGWRQTAAGEWFCPKHGPAGTLAHPRQEQDGA